MAAAWLRASSLQSHCPQVLTAHKELNEQIKFPTSSGWAELKSSLTFHPATKILKISYVQQVTNWLWFPCAQDVRNIWDIYFFCFVWRLSKYSSRISCSSTNSKFGFGTLKFSLSLTASRVFVHFLVTVVLLKSAANLRSLLFVRRKIADFLLFLGVVSF